MHETHNYLGTQVTGPVGEEGIPDQISIEDSITVKGRIIKVNLIRVTEYLAEIRWGNEVLARPGDVKRLVAESEQDIPSEEERSRKWIEVQHCYVIPEQNLGVSSKKGEPLIVTSGEWDSLSRLQKDLYTEAFRETASFLFYGTYPRVSGAVGGEGAVGDRFRMIATCGDARNAFS
jgi:hypothetical protein